MKPKVKEEISDLIERNFPNLSGNGLVNKIIRVIEDYSLIFNGDNTTPPKFSLMNHKKSFDLLKEYIQSLYGIKDDMFKVIRKRKYVDARTLFSHFLFIHNEHYNFNDHMPLKSFGYILGKDHSTILYYRKRYDELSKFDAGFRNNAEICTEYYKNLENNYYELFKNTVTEG